MSRQNPWDEWQRSWQPTGRGHAQATVDGAHDAVHRGYAFTLTHFFDEVANSANADILVVTTEYPNAGAMLHVQEWQVSPEDGPMFLYLYEGVTTSDDGTEISRVNHTRWNTPRTAGATAYHTPTVTDLGTLLYSQPVYDPGGILPLVPDRLALPGQLEWLLGTSTATKYLFRVTNSAGSAADVWQRLFWYERDQEEAHLR